MQDSLMSNRTCSAIQIHSIHKIRDKASRGNCSCCLVSCLLLDISEESGAPAILIILILTYSGDPSISLDILSLPVPTVTRMSRSSTFHPLISHALSSEGVLQIRKTSTFPIVSSIPFWSNMFNTCNYLNIWQNTSNSLKSNFHTQHEQASRKKHIDTYSSKITGYSSNMSYPFWMIFILVFLFSSCSRQKLPTSAKHWCSLWFSSRCPPRLPRPHRLVWQQ